MTAEGAFIWYELATTDVAAAETFYAGVVGWTVADSGRPDMRYTLANVGGAPVAGLMDVPEQMRADGIGPRWSGYVAVADVDGAAARVAQAGGSVHRPPEDIPGIGRFAVVGDPQGAVFMLFRGAGEPPARPDPRAPGLFGWNELIARDWEAAFAFYAALFGWTKGTAVDMGPMGTYQLFEHGGVTIGGMMSGADRPESGCGGNPIWRYYILVEDIDAAALRVKAHGGAVDSGPHQVPGGDWIVHARDPQGAFFALVGPRAA